MTQFLTENPYYADAYGFQGDALIYREAAGLFVEPSRSRRFSMAKARLGRVSGSGRTINSISIIA
jgi:hypothetical protein